MIRCEVKTKLLRLLIFPPTPSTTASAATCCCPLFLFDAIFYICWLVVVVVVEEKSCKAISTTHLPIDQKACANRTLDHFGHDMKSVLTKFNRPLSPLSNTLFVGSVLFVGSCNALTFSELPRQTC